MLIVDSSVWIDYFNNRDTWHTQILDQQLLNGRVGMLDVILLEILRGIRHDNEYRRVKTMLGFLPFFQTMSREDIVHCADCYRSLRKRGITIRKQNDVVIAAFCIRQSIPLLFADRDFSPFVVHLGLWDARELYFQS